MLKSTKKQISRSNSEGSESTKSEMRPKAKSIAEIRDDEDWKSLQTSITILFTEKKLQRNELDVLNEKVRKIRESNYEAYILECFKDSILKKGMIVLRHQVNQKEKKTRDLLHPLGEIWCDFYKEILISLQAIFYPIQSKDFRIRSTTLIGFRDMVLFKTKIFDVLQHQSQISKDIKQMLLVLATERDTDPKTKLPTENYMKLEELMTRVFRPYIGVHRFYPEKPILPEQPPVETIQHPTHERKERSSSYSQIFSKFTRSGSVISNSSEANNNNGNETGFSNPAFTEYSPTNDMDTTTHTPGSGDNSKSADNDMLAYLELRNQRWRNRNEMLTTESLV